MTIDELTKLVQEQGQRIETQGRLIAHLQTENLALRQKINHMYEELTQKDFDMEIAMVGMHAEINFLKRKISGTIANLMQDESEVERDD